VATDVLSLPEVPIHARRYVLPDEIPALQLVATENGRARWGPLVRLPRGAELSVLGVGFDDRTLRVRLDSCFYIVFKQDFDSAHRPAARTKPIG
jgi:hypothetical protein